jgi:hypothetical protein
MNNASFGPSPGAITASGADTLIAFAGNDHDLYDQTRTNGLWAAGHAHALGDYTLASPAIIAFPGGSDALVVVAKTGGTLQWTRRTGGIWSAPVDLATGDPNATSSAPVALVRTSTGALCAWSSASSHSIYWSTYTANAMSPWSKPAALANPNPTSNESPALAPGVGGADAELLFVDDTSGAATHARYTAMTGWTAPVAAGGVKVSGVAVSSAP